MSRIQNTDGPPQAKTRTHGAENASGAISVLTVNGDRGSVTVLKDGLKTPTGIEPVGETLWYTERGVGKAESIPLPK